MSGLQLLAPSALLALIPLAGAVVLLYLLKLRRREFVVPSTFLWRRAAQDVEANTPFQRLRKNLLMLLQLLALAAVVLALASPYILARRLGGASVVLVIDASASMNATDVSPSRFEEARRQATDIVKGMGRRDEVAVVVCAQRAWVALPFTGDQRAALSALSGLSPTDCPTDMRDAVLLALSLTASRQNAQVYVISDGAFPPLPEAPTAGNTAATVSFLRVGTGSDNVAILAFEASRAPGSQDTQLFVRVRNYSSQARTCALSISLEESLLDARRLELKAGENRVETYQVALKEPGLLKAELDAHDALQADNVAYAFSQGHGATSVLLVTPGNLFVEQGLLVLPSVEVHKTAGLTAEQAVGAYQTYDVIVFDRVPPPSVPRTGGFMLIATDGWGEPASLGAALAPAAVTQSDAQHPVLRYVNLPAAQIARAHALLPSPGATVLAGSDEGALVVALDRPGLRAVAFGWDFLDSDLPMRVGFPVLISNCLQWLAEASGAGQQTVTRPGQTVAFAAGGDAGAARVTLPDGRTSQVEATEGRYVFPETERVGCYTMQAGAHKWRWAVDLRHARESDITPGEKLALGGRTVPANAEPPQVERHAWPWLALAALLVLLFEWHLYHRRY